MSGDSDNGGSGPWFWLAVAAGVIAALAVLYYYAARVVGDLSK